MDLLGIIALFVSTIWTFAASTAICIVSPFNVNWGHSIQRFWGWTICRLYAIRLEIFYAPQIPAGGVILAPNHQSMFDGPTTVQLPVNFKWVAKRDVLKIPLFGWAMWAIGGYFLRRDHTQGDINIMKEVEDGLRRGDRIMIFPEGTRTRDGALQPLKKGIFRSAQNAGVPICPIAIHGSFEVAPPRHIPIRRGFYVTLRVGKPLYPVPGEDATVYMERYRKELVRLLEENSAS